MSSYTTEEQQVEELKKWWQENGKSVIFGLIIGLGGVAAWKGWTSYQVGVNEKAANAFEQVAYAMSSGTPEAAAQQATQLQTEFKGTAYASFAAMVEARAAADAGDATKARNLLEIVVKNPPSPAIGDIARLRLARLHYEAQDYSAASALLTGYGAAFAGEFAHLKGDIAAAQGDGQAAAAAYGEAIAKNVSDAGLVQMKIDDLGLPPTQASD